MRKKRDKEMNGYLISVIVHLKLNNKSYRLKVKDK